MNTDGDTGSAPHARAPLLRALPWIIGVGLLAWKAALLRIMPLVYLDTPWSIGPAFSMMRGDLLGVDFATYHLTFNQYPWLYFALAAGWYSIVGTGILATHGFFFALIGLQLVVIMHILRSRGADVTTSTLIVAAWMTTTYTYSFRFEGVGVTVLLLLVARIHSRTQTGRYRDPLIAMLAAAAILTHPVPAVLSCAIVAWWLIAQRGGWGDLVFHASIILFATGILYLPLVLLDVHRWLSIMLFDGLHHTEGMSAQFLLKYIARSPMIAVLLLIALTGTLRQRLWGELIPMLLLVLALSLIVRSNYFHYIPPILLAGSWLQHPSRLPRLVAACMIIASPIITHYLPMFWIVEHPAYARTLRDVIRVTDSVGRDARPGRIYATPQIVLELADRPGSRLMYAEFPARAGHAPVLDSGDVILFHTPGAVRDLVAYFPTDQIGPITTLVPPVKGLRTYPYDRSNRRSDSLGLWMVHVLHPPREDGRPRPSCGAHTVSPP